MFYYRFVDKTQATWGLRYTISLIKKVFSLSSKIWSNSKNWNHFSINFESLRNKMLHNNFRNTLIENFLNDDKLCYVSHACVWVTRAHASLWMMHVSEWHNITHACQLKQALVQFFAKFFLRIHLLNCQIFLSVFINLFCRYYTHSVFYWEVLTNIV